MRPSETRMSGARAVGVRWLRASAARILALVVLVFLVTGCEERDRDNPFDPRNPETGGVPPAIGAQAGDDRIDLVWDLVGFDDVASVALERTEAAQAPEVLAPSVGLAGSWRDDDVANGTTYAYQLVIHTHGGVRLESGTDLATPGASIVWVADASGLGLGRLTPDGRDLAERLAVGAAFLDLAIDLEGGVWAADFFGGQVAQFDRNGNLVRLLERAGANTVVHDPFSAQVWVGSFLERSLSRYSVVDGRLTLQLDAIGATEDLEVEPFPGSGVWVATQDEGLLRVSGDQVVETWEEFVWPVALARDPAGVLWVVDRSAGSVSGLQIATGQLRVATAVLVDPRDCALDGAGGLLVADPGRGGIVHVDAAGQEVGFWDLPAASGITRDPLAEQFWVVFRDNREVGVFDADGNEQSRVRVAGSPVKVEGFWN